MTTDDVKLIQELRLSLGRISRRMRNEKADRRISDSQVSALWRLSELGECTIGALSDRECVTAPSMTRTVQALEQAGYLERNTAPDDGRKVLLRLTDAGSILLTETVRRRNETFDAMLNDLSPEDRAAVIAAAPGLKKMADL